MNEPFVKNINQVNTEIQSHVNDELSAVRRWTKQGSGRLEIARHILWNTSAIISSTTYMLFAEQPQLSVFRGDFQKSYRIADLLNNILKFIIYALVAHDFIILDNYDLSELRELCDKDGLPIDSVIAAIKKMKEITLTSLTFKEEQRELTISEIRESYPRQWITIQVTKSKNGFPVAGKVIYFHYDLEVLSDCVKNSENIMYTFFTSKIDEKPEPLVKIVNATARKEEITSIDQSLLRDLGLYFDKVISIILENYDVGII